MNITIQPISKPEVFFNEEWQMNQALTIFNKRLVVSRHMSLQTGVTLPSPCYDSILQGVKAKTERYIQEHQVCLSQRLKHDIQYWLKVLEAELTKYPNERSALHHEIMENNLEIIAELKGLKSIIQHYGIIVGIKHIVTLSEKYGPLFPIDLDSPSYADCNIR